MIKLSDFARVQGVTPRAVQKLFKKYKSDLEGHFEEKGQNGTWFDETAQEFLRSHMKQNPVILYDANASPLLAEMEALRAENKDLKDKLSGAFEQLAASREYQLQLQAQLTEQKLLTAASDQKAAEAETALTEARERAEAAEDIAEMNAQEAARAKEAAEAARGEAERKTDEAEALREELERLKKRNLWQRIFNK